MKEIHINILAVCLISVVLLSACSVTKHLPEGEVLYTGSKTVILNKIDNTGRRDGADGN